MKLRVFVFALAYTACLCGQKTGQKGFDFTEACFKNPTLPYCPQRDFVNKPAKPGANPYSIASPSAPGKPTIDGAGIDWRFADPSADTIAVLDCSRLSATAAARTLIGQLATTQGLTAAQAQNIFRALSGVSRVALSIHENDVLMMITGRPENSVLPALESGWKAVPLDGNAILIGHSGAVDQASQRLATATALGDLPQKAQQRTAGAEFWTVGVAKLAGQDAVAAGVKRFELSASMQGRLTSDTVFEFDQAPDSNAIQPWLRTLGDAKIDGSVVRVTTSMEIGQAQQSLGQIAVSPLGYGLGSIINSARFIPVRDSATTVHSKPVIYGLDGGPKEVN